MHTHTHTHTHTQSVHTVREHPSTPQRVPGSCVVEIYMTRWQTDSGRAAILPVSLLMLTVLLLWLCMCHVHMHSTWMCVCALVHIQANASRLQKNVHLFCLSLSLYFLNYHCLYNWYSWLLLFKNTSIYIHSLTHTHILRHSVCCLIWLLLTEVLAPSPLMGLRLLPLAQLCPHTEKQKVCGSWGAGALIISPAGGTGLAASFSPSIFSSVPLYFQLGWLAAQEWLVSCTI